MGVLKLAESVHHLLFEVASNLLDHLDSVEWRWMWSLYFRWKPSVVEVPMVEEPVE